MQLPVEFLSCTMEGLIGLIVLVWQAAEKDVRASQSLDRLKLGNLLKHLTRSQENRMAVLVQAHFRGYQARKLRDHLKRQQFSEVATKRDVKQSWSQPELTRATTLTTADEVRNLASFGLLELENESVSGSTVKDAKLKCHDGSDDQGNVCLAKKSANETGELMAEFTALQELYAVAQTENGELKLRCAQLEANALEKHNKALSEVNAYVG